MEKLATSYAIRLEKCKSNDDLAFICAEIAIDLMDIEGLDEWRGWLLTVVDTAWHNINDPVPEVENG